MTPCAVQRQHGGQCSRDVEIDAMIVEIEGIQALSDQRFAAFIPRGRMDMLAADKLQVALVICEAVCAFPQRKR